MKSTSRMFKASLLEGGVILFFVIALTGQAIAQGGAWETKAPMPTARFGLSADTINGILYVVGGVPVNSTCSFLPTLEAYDPATDTWTTKAPMPTGRVNFDVGVVNNILYAVGGGVSCGGYVATNEAYDPVSNIWTTKAPMPAARHTHGVGVVNDILYAAGGHGSGGSGDLLASVVAYDPVPDTWTSKAPIPTPRYALGVGVLNGVIYAVGGTNGISYFATVEAYDPVSNTWTTKAPMPRGRFSPRVEVVNGILYALGGVNSTGFIPEVDAYNPLTDTWTTVAAIPTPRTELAVAVANGVLYAVGGHNGNPRATNEAFTPGVPPTVPPTAEAGANQSIHAGQTVHLDGSGSLDDTTPTQNLQYAWSFTSVPPGSTATLSATNINPTFVADLSGTYVVRLVVTDADGRSSNPDEVTISSLNAPPNAEAGPDQGTFVGNLVTLNGSASNDPDFDPITFSWTLITQPPGSTAALSNANTATPTLLPVLPGSYVAELIVSDPFVASAPDTVTIAVITTENFAEKQTMTAINTVGLLPLSSVTTKGNQTALGNFLNQVIAALQVGDIGEAKKKLQDAIERTDGCALRGSPDLPGGGQIKQDYIKTCTDQAPVYMLLKAALDALYGH